MLREKKKEDKKKLNNTESHITTNNLEYHNDLYKRNFTSIHQSTSISSTWTVITPILTISDKYNKPYSGT